jgi:hypothetical protein
MSKNINVNPGQYKVAGREHMGEQLGQENERRAFSESKKAQAAETRGKRQEGAKPRASKLGKKH